MFRMRCCLIILISLCSAFNAFSQKEHNHWMLGSYLSMNFNGGTNPMPPLLSKMYAPRGCAAISDKNTGALLFYTNGRKIFNRQHQVMPNGNGLTGVDFDAHDVIAVPFPQDPMKYFIFIVINTQPFTSNPDCNLFYATVDMRLNAGLGDVVSKARPIANWMDHHICVVKQYYDNGYWLITHKKGTADFYVFPVSDDSVHVSNPRISKAGTATYPDNDFRYGTLISDSKGTTLAHTFGKQGMWAHCELLDFDKKCGTVKLQKELFPFITQLNEEVASCAFSPDDKQLYVGWNYLTSSMILRIYQYDLGAADVNASKQIIGNLLRAPGDMRLAPDGRIYITMADESNACAFLSVIKKPDLKGASCDFAEKGIDLAPGHPSPNFFTEYLPNFMSDRSTPMPQYKRPEVTVKASCLEDPAEFTVKGNFDADSVKWKFGDQSFASGVYSTTHQYTVPGDYDACFSWFLCGIEYQICNRITVGKKPVVELGKDTTLCPGIAYKLDAYNPGARYLWSTGDSSSNITVKSAAKYWVDVYAGSCKTSKSVDIKYHPSIWTLLGDEYFICEKEKELVKLDAGEGFPNYKWIPTGDTTQWIIVGQLGKYLVIVQDFRGCNGEDSTKVDERCPLRIYFPNAFSPNSDGKNDFFSASGTGIVNFELTVYNRWGEQVFYSNNILKGWDGSLDGKAAAEGSYYYVCRYSGYVGKKLRSREDKGVLTLLR